MNTDRWKTLEVWQLSDQLAKSVYQTRTFPKEEIYAITSQVPRAALSVPTNIVEGYSRRDDRELARFIDIALGSLAETKYLLHFSHDLEYVDQAVFDDLSQRANDLGAKLWKFYEIVRKGS